MKKLLIALAFVGFGTASAQEYVPVKKHSVATNSFWSNWFVSVGGHYQASFSNQEASDIPFAPFKDRRGEFGFNVAVCKWFTPGLGLRTKFEGIWSDRVNTKTSHDTYQYWNIHEDVMFNLSNMLFGYNENRVWNFIPYVGIGVARNMTDNNYDLSYNAGILNNFRLGKRVSLFLDVYANAMEGTFDGAAGNFNDYRKDRARHWDKNLGAALGLTFNLGKANWDKVPDVDAIMAMNAEQVNALKNSLKDMEDENARLRDMLANQPVAAETKVVTKEVAKYVGTGASVFFNISSSKIASKKDLVNVQEVANYAKANNAKLVVTGYADSKTGNAEINNKLSQARAEVVAEELVKMGVSRDNIVIESKGGVNTLEPASYNRRAVVTVK